MSLGLAAAFSAWTNDEVGEAGTLAFQMAAVGMLGDGGGGNNGLTSMSVLPLQTLGTPLGGIGGDNAVSTPGRCGRKKEDRIPQWGYHETKEFIGIRAELEKDFTQTKRNKTLWELIAGKMKEKGFRRSADQCKCKWKNLVNRYKGKEISEPDNGRQCPFFEELDAIFKERAKNMDRLLLESDGMRPKKRLKKLKRGLVGDGSEDDSDDDDEEDEESEEDERVVKRKKRKADKERQRSTAEKCRASSMQEVLEEFFQQQGRIEEQWREAVERREEERRVREEEWREAMEKVEQERIMREHSWWEREEQRRMREEMRAEKRDELVQALFNKILRQD